MSARANKSLSVRRRLAASPLALLLAFPIRIRAALRHLLIETSNLVHWLYASRETTNFNYDISDLNRLHLAWWIADIAKVPVGDILDYFAEVEGDLSLRQHIRRATLASPYWRISDANAAFGRRLGWYALVRAVKPLHVVETGIDKGLGTVLLSSALLKNGNGRITAIDTAPGSGWMQGPGKVGG
jgi:hypothetical protein